MPKASAGSIEDFAIAEWESYGQPETGLTMVTNGKLYPFCKYGLQDSQGKMVIPMEYESISYAEGLLIMTKYRFTNSGPVGRDGLYDLKGNVVYSASHYSDQTIRLLDKENKLLLIGSWVGGSVGSRLGIFDLQLNQLTPVDYDEVRPLSNGCYQLSKRSGSGSSIFDIFKLGKGVIIPCEYSSIRSFGGELFVVKKGNSGLIVVDEQCKQVIPGSYDSVLDLKTAISPPAGTARWAWWTSPARRWSPLRMRPLICWTTALSTPPSPADSTTLWAP